MLRCPGRESAADWATVTPCHAPTKASAFRLYTRVTPIVAQAAQRAADNKGWTLSDWISHAIKTQAHLENQRVA